MNLAKLIFEKIDREPARVREILVEMHARGEKVSEILDFVKFLDREKIAVKIPEKKIFDVCGTGGSGKTRINISTALAVKISQKFAIAKHGNRAASGRIGSFDLLERAGIEFSDSPEKVQKNLREKNLAFVFAPAFHPILKKIAAIRKSISHPTIFNFLGPLLNPVENLTAQLVGVANEKIGEKLAEVAQILEKNILFVHDQKFGLDEVSIGGATIFWEVRGGRISSGKFFPENFDFPRVENFSEISGSQNLDENFEIFSDLIADRAPDSPQNFLKINQKVAENFFEKF